MSIIGSVLLGGVLGAYFTFMGWIAWDTHKGYRELNAREQR